MSYSSFFQETLKRGNREKILSLISERRRGFTELQKTTGFSPMGLSKMLKDLVKEGKIEKENLKSRKSPYKIKGSSSVTAKELVFPGREINEIKYNGGKYYFDLTWYHRSEIFDYGPAFGITTHLLIDKQIGTKRFVPLSGKDIFEIEKLVFDRIYAKYHSGGALLNESASGKAFLILEIDYKEFVKLIKTRTKEENEKLVRDKLQELKLNP